MQNKTIQNNNKLWLWIIFIIYPLGAFIYSIKNFAIKKYRIFLLAFFMFYGYTFVPIPDSDGSRYQEDFATTKDYTFSEYKYDIQSVFTGEANNPDFYAPTLKFLVHSFTNNAQLYFLIAALIYFFILLKLLDAIWDFVAQKRTFYYLSFFIGCCFIYNISAGINSIRFPLAFMIFAYGALNLILKDEKKYLFLTFLAVLVHFALSYSFAFLFVIYVFRFKSNMLILYSLLLLVFIFSSVFPTFIEQNIELLGKASRSKFTGYTEDGFLETREQKLQVWNWYVYFNFYATYFFVIISLFLTRIKYFKIKFDTVSEKLFVFSIVMLIHSILSASVVDVVSNRYNVILTFFSLLYLLSLSLNNHSNKLLRCLNYIYIPILIINILVKLRGDLYTVNAMVVLGNVIATFFIDIKISIQDLLLG